MEAAYTQGSRLQDVGDIDPDLVIRAPRRR